MRFLMLNWRDPRNPRAGGAERVTQGYLAALARRGHEVVWFSYDFEGAVPDETLDGIRIVRAGGIATAVLEAVAWHRNQPRFDLVIDQHHGMPWYAPWWCGTNCVAYIHEVLGPIWAAFYPWPFSAIGRWQERQTHWCYRQVPFWTASRHTQELLLQHGVRRVTLLPYGVPTLALPSLEPKPLRPPLRLAVVSRLAPNKRVDHALRAAYGMQRRGIAVCVTVVGVGEVERDIRRLVDGLGMSGSVTFAGALPETEKDAVLRQAHFLLHTSLREGWGLNVIEANAMGTPAAVYPVAGLVESTLDRETGLVARAETPEALTEVLAGALQDPDAYQVWRRRAWERARTFHWDHVLPAACDWLEQQARERPPGFTRRREDSLARGRGAG
jgi:glycosyltransferase involved in cell wall biosynthesis